MRLTTRHLKGIEDNLKKKTTGRIARELNELLRLDRDLYYEKFNKR